MSGLYIENKFSPISGRYVIPDDFADLLKNFNPEVIGKSVKGEPISMVTMGTGPKKILAWSQMHGNEATTTKAMADFINAVSRGNFEELLKQVTMKFIPILNPDGARAYTRENAAGADLNRDFGNISQPETKALLAVFNGFSPDFCFNMHDQRTIFGVGDSGKPATVSFLAPAFNEERSVNSAREKAMEVIAVMNDVLRFWIPDMVGRFDDSFNPHCVGDAFSMKGVPTILVEAGHFPGDYQRETTREMVFYAFVAGLVHIGGNEIVGRRTADYLTIPQNKISFYDFVYRNVKINYDSTEIITNFAVQIKELLFNGKIGLNARIASVGPLDNFKGHTEYDGQGENFSSALSEIPEVGQEADFFIGSQRFVNGVPSD